MALIFFSSLSSQSSFLGAYWIFKDDLDVSFSFLWLWVLFLQALDSLPRIISLFLAPLPILTILFLIFQISMWVSLSRGPLLMFHVLYLKGQILWSRGGYPRPLPTSKCCHCHEQVEECARGSCGRWVFSPSCLRQQHSLKEWVLPDFLSSKILCGCLSLYLFQTSLVLWHPPDLHS